MDNELSWVKSAELRVAEKIPVHPHLLSLIKVGVAGVMLWGIRRADATSEWGNGWLFGLFLLFALFDYLDGMVARRRGMDSAMGRVLDRLTDLPVFLVLAYTVLPMVPLWLLGVKVVLDALLLIIYVAKKTDRRHRVRTAASAATLLVLLLLGQGVGAPFITPKLAIYLLYLNIAYTVVITLIHLRFLQKRFIADSLSLANLLCGVFSMIFAADGRFDVSLLLLLLGAGFDGFDGAAARKFGGTRFGVYSDDIADGVNYGIAPGVALFFALSGVEGVVLGIFFSLFTISRLVYFTLNKAFADPNFFCGVPSTVGGIVVLCAIILFDGHHALLGLLVGIACVQMVSFDVLYRHLGRALSLNRRVVFGMPAILIFMVLGRVFLDDRIPFAVILAAALFYGFLPTLTHFSEIIQKKQFPAGQ